MMMRISTRLYEYCDKSRLENLIKSRLEKCVDSQIFMPVGLTNRPSYGTLAKSTIPLHIPYRFYAYYLQNTYRLPNGINYCFIFKKPFFN